MAQSKEQPILIIGAGITGLLIAQGLKQAGVPFEVFESEDANAARRRREWTMGVHWGVPLLDHLLPPELVARLREACVDKTLDYLTPPTNGSRIYDGVTGEVLKELLSEGKLLRVSRRKMRALCGEGVDVKFGHKLEKIDVQPNGLPKAVFTNGVGVEGSIVIGTDGPRSCVRTLLFGADKAQATPMEGIINTAVTISYDDAEKARFVRTAHPVWCMSLSPDIFSYICIQDVPDPDKPETWQFYLFWSWYGNKEDVATSADRLKLMKEKASKIQDPFRSAILWLPDDAELPFLDLTAWVASPWDTHHGTITLAGDAVHPMPPFRGQGLNHAIQDAYNFVQLAKKLHDGSGQDQSTLVQEYSDEVAKRGAQETAMSTKNGEMLVAYHDFKNSPYMKHGLSRPGGSS